MSAPSWVTANMSEMSRVCWRLFLWQWCSTLCQSGLHLGPLENDLWQTRPSPYIKLRPHVLQCVKLRDSFRTNGPFHVRCVIVAFFTFYKKNYVSWKWLTSGETILRSTGEFMRYMTCVRPTTAEGCHLPSGKLSQTFAFLLPPGEDVQLNSLKFESFSALALGKNHAHAFERNCQCIHLCKSTRTEWEVKTNKGKKKEKR